MIRNVLHSRIQAILVIPTSSSVLRYKIKLKLTPDQVLQPQSKITPLSSTLVSCCDAKAKNLNPKSVHHLLQVREKYQEGGKESPPSSIHEIDAIFTALIDKIEGPQFPDLRSPFSR